MNRSLLASAFCLAASAAAASAQQTYTIGLFPELPVVGSQVSLSFDPRLAEPALHGATVTQTRLFVTFTTLGFFDASELVIQLTTPIDSETFGLFLVSGADLGWSGQGTFTASLSSADLNGVIPDGGRAVWFFDLFRANADPASFSGEFGADSRIEIDYLAAVAPCPVDFDRNGEVNADDLSDFITAYFAEDPATDFNGDGEVNADDLSDFITAFFAGCG